jgi:hypothetical protein
MADDRAPEGGPLALGSVWTMEEIDLGRARVGAAVREHGLRTVGVEIGRSTTGLRKFIARAQPHPTTLRKLEAWVLREGPERGDGAEAEVLAGAVWASLLDGLPEEVRRELRVELEGRIREVREGDGAGRPEVVESARERLGPRS